MSTTATLRAKKRFKSNLILFLAVGGFLFYFIAHRLPLLNFEVASILKDMSYFDAVEESPPDPILGLGAAFKADPRADKVDLTVGVYRNEGLDMVVMDAVKEAEQRIWSSEKNKTYLPIDGDHAYVGLLAKNVFGEGFVAQNNRRLVGVQGLGGTGSLRVGLEFLSDWLSKSIYVSNPTWPNHLKIAMRCGMDIGKYPYYDEASKGLSFQEMKTYVSGLKPKSIVMLHACCHNPTGVDLKREQWQELAHIFKEKGLFAFFDCAYQGFGDGLEEDVAGIRVFAESGLEMAVASSCSKNFGLYGERVGALFFLLENEKVAKNVRSTLKPLMRANYSNPPRHGAAIVAEILSSPDLKAKWEKELTEMRERMKEMRTALADELGEGFSFMKERKGMFSYTGLTSEEVLKLRNDAGIYMTGSGRINVCGLNSGNMKKVAGAVKAVKN